MYILEISDTFWGYTAKLVANLRNYRTEIGTIPFFANGKPAAVREARRDVEQGPVERSAAAVEAAVLPSGSPAGRCCRLQLYRARSRLYGNEILRVNMRLKALAEI